MITNTNSHRAITRTECAAIISTLQYNLYSAIITSLTEVIGLLIIAPTCGCCGGINTIIDIAIILLIIDAINRRQMSIKHDKTTNQSVGNPPKLYTSLATIHRYRYISYPPRATSNSKQRPCKTPADEINRSTICCGVYLGECTKQAGR